MANLNQDKGQQSALLPTRNREFENWVKCAYAFHYLKAGLEDFVSNTLVPHHHHLKQKVTQIYPDARQCSDCTIHNLLPDHGSGKCNHSNKKECLCSISKQSKQPRRKCLKNFCSVFYHLIVEDHVKKFPRLSCVDPSNWYNDWFEYTKCFIGSDTSANNLTELDCTAFLSIVIQNRQLLQLIDNVDAFKECRENRNRIFHTGSYKITDKECNAILDKMIAVLEDKTTLVNDQKAHANVVCLKELKLNQVDLSKDILVELIENSKDAIQTLGETAKDEIEKKRNIVSEDIRDFIDKITLEKSKAIQVLKEQTSEAVAEVNKTKASAISKLDDEAKDRKSKLDEHVINGVRRIDARVMTAKDEIREYLLKLLKEMKECVNKGMTLSSPQDVQIQINTRSPNTQTSQASETLINCLEYMESDECLELFQQAERALSNQIGQGIKMETRVADTSLRKALDSIEKTDDENTEFTGSVEQRSYTERQGERKDMEPSRQMKDTQTSFRMSRKRDARSNISQKLSEVMNDIGVNERMVQKRRRAYKIIQALFNLTSDDGTCIDIIGSQSEGSSTLGLDLDTSYLVYDKEYTVINDLSECKQANVNLLVIQNEDIPPGYCYLQLIDKHTPIPETKIEELTRSMKSHVKENVGYITNTFANLVWLNSYWEKGRLLHIMSGSDINIVPSFYCASVPHQVLSWIKRQRMYSWPTADVLRRCSQVGFFVLGVGSMVSDRSELEWRISTYLQERYIMMNLNIIQISCYILMKLFLKTYIHPSVEGVLSSYMCKNVLWYCISEKPYGWYSENLLSYFHMCLSRLRECLERTNCPHFIIPENNLMAGRISETQRSKILNIIDDVVDNDGKLLFGIQIDDLGERLMTKLGLLPQSSDIPSATKLSQKISLQLIQKIMFSAHSVVLKPVLHDKYSPIFHLHRTWNSGTDFESLNAALKVLEPLNSSTVGSMMASEDIASKRAISDIAIQYLEYGKDSDVLSGRLRLLSVLYCTGDMERAEREIDSILRQYDESSVPSLCYHYHRMHTTENIMKACDEYNEEAIKSHIATCMEFVHSEINCVPHELKFEMCRMVTAKDRHMRIFTVHPFDGYIVIDSVPYLHFLQYKIYGKQLKREEQMQALIKLQKCLIAGKRDFRHLDTAFNLTGQCFEHENMQAEALGCYISSLRVRRHYNAANILLCLQLFKLLKQ